MFYVLFSIVPRLCCNVMAFIQEVTVLRLGCGQGNVSAGQWGSGRRDNRASVQYGTLARSQTCQENNLGTVLPTANQPTNQPANYSYGYGYS